MALILIPMKCFHYLVLQHIKDNIPASLGPHQYAFRTNRTTEEAISTALHSVFTHLEKVLLYQDAVCFVCSPMKLIGKLNTLDLSSTLCNWILAPLWIGICSKTPSMLVHNPGVPHGCVLSPLLFALYPHDCTPRHREHSTVKYADNTIIVSCIINNNESSYKEEINHFCKAVHR